MSSARSAGYQLTHKAIADLDDIWRYSAETWSVAQADRFIDDLVHLFDILADMPTMARERPEFSPPVRLHPFGSSLIVYRVDPDHITILRLLGGSQNWQDILHAIDR
ncbi:type II toxin-antitoxin system RelE/ParE family toxin [Thalassospira sp.]|uniref:type II toxin-antitoxin system RelE/ParE family toxin n=1 Tax=Thalassospira sp. TaxID=1912094 RepID=UPI0027332FC5|nr:type II toxin-antitoxin system RelE/ParE family toxin [Thalassospira sp.]MDP2697052.1 type II toxin-antitoxin system RelE/ParE family toxin [Thalassospira sp.]